MLKIKNNSIVHIQENRDNFGGRSYGFRAVLITAGLILVGVLGN